MCADDGYRLKDYTAAKQQVAELVHRSKQTLHDLGIREGEENAWRRALVQLVGEPTAQYWG